MRQLLAVAAMVFLTAGLACSASTEKCGIDVDAGNCPSGYLCIAGGTCAKACENGTCPAGACQRVQAYCTENQPKCAPGLMVCL